MKRFLNNNIKNIEIKSEFNYVGHYYRFYHIMKIFYLCFLSYNNNKAKFLYN